MRKLFLCILLLPALLSAQEPDSNWIRKNYVKREVYIPMRDGVKLFTSIYLPKENNEKHPILLTRTPYSCAPYGEKMITLPVSHYKEYYKIGYIMVKQDVRGRWMSEGNFVDVRPYKTDKSRNNDTDETTDTYDTIDWLVKNLDNNNGNVGVFGISYPGFYATMASMSRHPALKAVSPQAPVTDWFIGDDFHHNGAFMLTDAFAFYSGFGKPRPLPTTTGPTGFNFPTKDNYEFYLRTGSLANFARLMGDSIAFWKDLYAHPDYDSWWKARNPRNFVQQIPASTATLVVGGLFDAEDCFGAWNLYKAIEAKAQNNNKLVIGPWYHGQWASGDGWRLGNVQFGSNTSEWYGQHIELPFFEYYLRGKGSPDGIKEANVFFTGVNEWHQFPKWPAASMQPKDIYLQSGNQLSFTRGSTGSYAEYTSDPAKPVPYTEDVHYQRTRNYMTDDQRFAARRPDVLVFQSAVLQEDLTLAGPLTAELKVAISGTDADFVVKLIDVFPDDFDYPPGAAPVAASGRSAAVNPAYIMNGYQMLVRGDVMRGRYRNSFEKPEVFVPNKPTVVKYTMPDIAHTFKKGHRIMVQVQSSWFPLADRNPQTFVDIYHAKDSDFKKETIRVFYGDSKLVLPVLRAE
ncbi:MAG: CocE/NonD family hydrolase [Chitinophagaceae bacterium]|nr:CocE/NonD family hydrolase [Chitinophagaceae bacterium]